MHLRRMKLLQQTWQRNVTSYSRRTAYIGEVQKLQRGGFYPVYVGKTEISERLVNEHVTPLHAKLKNQPTWSIIHAGGALGWVPWNYKLHFYLSDMMLKPDKYIFQELCAELYGYYGNCAIIVNPHVENEWQNMKRENTVYPTSPVELLPMTCCPEVAQAYGHKMLQIPTRPAHLSPLSIAWVRTKWYMMNHKEAYSQTFYYEGMIQNLLDFTDLVDGALNRMTRRKWADTVTKELGF